MTNLEEVMEALEKAKKRRKEIKKLVGVLVKEYDLLKKEIELHQKHVNRLVREKEYSQFLDTVKLEQPLSFP
jgi:hypothetical protein